MRISDWSSDVCSSDLRATITGFVGNGVPVLLQRVLRAVGETHDDDAVEALTPRFLGIYGAEPSALSRLYPGDAEALAALAAAGYRLGLCTNKPVAPARAVLDYFAIPSSFAAHRTSAA